MLYQGVQERWAQLFPILYCGLEAGVILHAVHTAAGSGLYMKEAVEPLELLTVGVSSLSGACYLSLNLDGSLQIRTLSGRGTQTPKVEVPGAPLHHMELGQPHPLKTRQIGQMLTCGLAEAMMQTHFLYDI